MPDAMKSATTEVLDRKAGMVSRPRTRTVDPVSRPAITAATPEGTPIPAQGEKHRQHRGDLRFEGQRTRRHAGQCGPPLQAERGREAGEAGRQTAVLPETEIDQQNGTDGQQGVPEPRPGEPPHDDDVKREGPHGENREGKPERKQRQWRHHEPEDRWIDERHEDVFAAPEGSLQRLHEWHVVAFREMPVPGHRTGQVEGMEIHDVRPSGIGAYRAHGLERRDEGGDHEEGRYGDPRHAADDGGKHRAPGRRQEVDVPRDADPCSVHAATRVGIADRSGARTGGSTSSKRAGLPNPVRCVRRAQDVWSTPLP